MNLYWECKFPSVRLQISCISVQNFLHFHYNFPPFSLQFSSVFITIFLHFHCKFQEFCSQISSILIAKRRGVKCLQGEGTPLSASMQWLQCTLVQNYLHFFFRESHPKNGSSRRAEDSTWPLEIGPIWRGPKSTIANF